MARFVYSKSGENEILRAKNGMTDRHMRSLASKIELLAKNQVGVDTGKLRGSIHTINIHSGMPGYRIGSSNKIARLHHNGSRPHMIYAAKGKKLKISRYGTIIYREKVFHPGTKPNRYLTDPLRAVI